MDALTLFGLLTVTLASVYGFLQGAWPFGAVEAIWAAVAVGRWRGKALQA